MIAFARKAVTVGFILAFAFAVSACADNPAVPRTALSARADTGARSDAVGPQQAVTSKQPDSAGVLQISDEIRAACGIDRGDAFFPFDSYSLQTKDVPVLNKVAACFTTGPLKDRGVRLVGHADPRGPSDYNMVLGQNRADSVSGYLRRHGVGQSQAEATSRGALDATGTNEPTWAQDRRVDVMVRQ